jgi:amidase
MAHLTLLSSLDATALADLVRSRSVSPLELVEATIARIEQINPSLNAIVTPMYDEARAVAAQPISGPFGGVPFLLKDLFASYAGVRLTGARGVCETWRGAVSRSNRIGLYRKARNGLSLSEPSRRYPRPSTSSAQPSTSSGRRGKG